MQPNTAQMVLAGVAPHLLDKGSRDNLKIQDEIADSLIELQKD